MELAQLSYLARQRGFAFASGMLQQVVLKSQGKRTERGPSELLRKRFLELLDRDWSNAASGKYPRELLFDNFAFAQVARHLPEMAAEIPRVLRRIKNRHADELPAEIDRDKYPDYYLRTFHWQTDGWFSRKSARLYDSQVELLFGGTSEVMRRQAIPPVMHAKRILDVACGTGRFIRQLRKAVPHAAITGLDLSPHYIAHARQLLQNDTGDVSLMVGNAEQLPFKDSSFDAVSCVFLFHELPKDARRNVMREIVRVLEPGGTLSISDSAQLIESEGLQNFLWSFQKNYHEPYYKSYIQDPLERLVEEVGLQLLSSEPHLVSKVVVARKPIS